jgi:hypothetical protein
MSHFIAIVLNQDFDDEIKYYLVLLAGAAEDGGSELFEVVVVLDGGGRPSWDRCRTFDVDIWPCHIRAPLDRRTPFEDVVVPEVKEDDDEVVAGEVNFESEVESDGLRWKSSPLRRIDGWPANK